MFPSPPQAQGTPAFSPSAGVPASIICLPPRAEWVSVTHEWFRPLTDSPSKVLAKVVLIGIYTSVTSQSLVARFTLLLTTWMEHTWEY